MKNIIIGLLLTFFLFSCSNEKKVLENRTHNDIIKNDIENHEIDKNTSVVKELISSSNPSDLNEYNELNLNFNYNNFYGEPRILEKFKDEECISIKGLTEILKIEFENGPILYGVNEKTCSLYKEGVGSYNDDIWSLPKYSKENPLVDFERIGDFYVSYGPMGYGPVKSFGIFFWSDVIKYKNYKQIYGSYDLFATAGKMGVSDEEFEKYSNLFNINSIDKLPKNIILSHEKIMSFLNTLSNKPIGEIKK